MGYTDFQGSEVYPSKRAGASVEILLFDEADLTSPIIGAASGLSYSDDYEKPPVEEAGNELVTEHTDGRHSGSGSINAFWSPQYNDGLPSPSEFIGKRYVIVQRVGPNYPQAGTVLNAFTKVAISRVGGSQGARGNMTQDVGFSYKKRWTGAEWAARTGTL
jgi:hypothetical protein